MKPSPSASTRRPILLLAALAFAACGGDVPPTSTTESATIGVTEELRLGVIDGPPEYSFGRIDEVTAAPDGHIYIADAQVPVIRRYDPEGTYLHDVGRGGEGPGEYRSIEEMGVTSEGELVVLDGPQSRVMRFTLDGDPVGSETAGIFSTGRVTRDGGVYLRMPPGGVFSEGPDAPPWEWRRHESGAETTLVHHDVKEAAEGPRYVISGRGGYYEPFNVKNIGAFGPDGSFYAGRNDEYRIVRTRPDGDTAVITRDREPVRVSPEEMEQWEAYSEYFADRSEGRIDRSRYFPVPDIKPHFRHLLVDEDGRLWVGLYTEPVRAPYDPGVLEERAAEGLPSLPLRTALRWDVFGPDNAYIGTVEFPPRTTIYEASGDRVWGAMTGEFGVDHFVRWRLDFPE